MKIGFICLILLITLMTMTVAQAGTYTYALTGGWLGQYAATEYGEGDVDFGHGFSSIQSVSMYWSGSTTSGLDDFLIPVRGHFETSLTEADVLWASASGPWSSQSYSFPTVNFNNTLSAFSANNWDFLLDGQAYLWIDYIPENNDYTNEDRPWGDLTSASLVVEGTAAAAPEPSSLLAMAAGLVGLAGGVRRRASLR